MDALVGKSERLLTDFPDDKVLDSLEVAFQNPEISSSIHWPSVTAFIKKGGGCRAYDVCKKLDEMGKDNADVQIFLGNYYYNYREPIYCNPFIDTAGEHYIKALGLGRKDSVSSLEIVVSIHFRRWGSDKAISRMREYFQYPSMITAINCSILGQLLLETGQYEEALQWFQKALTLDPMYIVAKSKVALLKCFFK